MTEFEDQLRRALERKDPSADFAARVMARATQPKRPLAWVNWRANGWSWAAVGVAARCVWAHWVWRWSIATESSVTGRSRARPVDPGHAHHIRQAAPNS